MGKELGDDFQAPTSMRSEITLNFKPGAKVGDIFGNLARRYPPIKEKVFDPALGAFNQYVIVFINDRAYPQGMVVEKTLEDGDKIRVSPVYFGG